MQPIERSRAGSSVCLLASGPPIWPGLDVAALALELSERGVALTARSDHAAAEVGKAAAILAGQDSSLPTRITVPTVVLSPSPVPGRLRLTELLPGVEPDPLPRNGRVSRLLAKWGVGFSDDAIGSALREIPPGKSAPGGRGRPIFAADSVDIWAALAEGLEFAVSAPSPLEGPALCDALDRRDGRASSPVFTRRRDHARRLVATEVILNAIPPTPPRIAAAVAEAIGAVGHRSPPTVSVVITNYNYRRFLGAAIESALGQTVPAEEVIVVDDGSVDGSAELVATTPGIIPILKPNGGQGSAFNAGFARTTGDLVLFLDSDDVLAPEAVETLRRTNLTGAARVTYPLATIDAFGRPLGSYDAGLTGNVPLTGFAGGALLTDGIFPFLPTSGNAFPRHVLERVLPVPEHDFRISADLYLVLATALLGDVVSLGSPLASYRTHGGNAYFDRLAAGPQRTELRLRQRRAAWSALAEHPPRGIDADLALRLRRALGRLVVASHEPPSSRRRVAPAASRRRTRRARLPAETDLPPVRSPRDLLEIGGRAGWPLVAPGTPVPLQPDGAPSPLGDGWGRDPTAGATMVARWATLALRLPEFGCHWRARLIVDSALPVVLEVGVNGAILGAFVTDGETEIVVDLPVELLPPWHEVVPRTALPGSAACLTLRWLPPIEPSFDRSPEAGIDVATLRSIVFDPLPATPAPAPLLPEGCDLAFSDALAGACLGSGWHWPAADGVRLASDQGSIQFSVARGGDVVLGLVLATGPEDAPPREDHVALLVEGEVIETRFKAHPHVPGCDRRTTLTGALRAGATGEHGRFAVTLAALPGPDTPMWSAVRLVGLRLDRVVPAGAGATLAPNDPLDGAGIVSSDSVGVVREGASARFTGGRFGFKVRPGPTSAPARLVLCIDRDGELVDPVDAMVGVNQTRIALSLGRRNTAQLVVEGAGRTLWIEGEIGTPDPLFRLDTIELVALPRMEVRGRELHRVEDAFGPHALFACALDPGAWHGPNEDALWLAANRAELQLPPLPDDVRALAVSVLTLPTLTQHLTLTVGRAPPTIATGLATVLLPRPAGCERIVVTTDRLVATDLLGLDGPGLLGGAIRSVALVCDAVAPPLVAEATG